MSPNFYNTFNERATLWLARVGSIGLALMMFLTLGDVIGRSFNHPITGAVEVTELIMGLMIYLGVGYTTFLKGHIRVDILITRFSAKTQAILDSFTGIIALIITALITRQLFIIGFTQIPNQDTTQIWELSLWPFGIIMASASVLMVAALILHITVSLRVALGLEDSSTYIVSQMSNE